MISLGCVILNACNNNTGATNSTTATNQTTTSATQQTSNVFTKGSALANYFYVIDLKNLTAADQVAISALQGILAQKSNKQLFLTNSDLSYYDADANMLWLTQTGVNYSSTYTNIWQLISLFKNNITGYIVYDLQNNPDSINIASSIAGLNNAIPIDKSQVATIQQQLGYTTPVLDVSTWTYDTLLNNYPNQFNKNFAVELAPANYSGPRDYAIANKALIFYNQSSSDFSLRNKIASMLNAPIPFLVGVQLMQWVNIILLITLVILAISTLPRIMQLIYQR